MVEIDIDKFKKDFLSQEVYLIINLIIFVISSILAGTILVFLCKRKRI